MALSDEFDKQSKLLERGASARGRGAPSLRFMSGSCRCAQ